MLCETCCVEARGSKLSWRLPQAGGATEVAVDERARGPESTKRSPAKCAADVDFHTL